MFLRDIQKKFGGDIVGEVSLALTGVATLERAQPDRIAFLANPRYRPALASTGAGAVIVGTRDREATDKPRIVTANPYAYFARVAQLFSPAPAFAAGIHPTAVVHPGASVAASASIAEFVLVGAGAVIGEGVRIGPGSSIGEGTVIGRNTLLHAHVTVYAGCRIGARGIIHSGAVIGADGFGFAPDFRDGDGTWVKIPQSGGVIIGDDCEIGACTTIDRGAIEDTVIGNDVKLDNQIQVGHNCRIGDHVVIAGNTAVAGSVHIGARVMIGGGSGIVGHVTICDDTVISAMTLITKSITEPGTYTSGGPMLPHREWLKNSVHLKHLDEMADAIKKKGS
jgi:UDP-3-O-[3-hydroxymyristoyl] glucosamine N-acyltransferase